MTNSKIPNLAQSIATTLDAPIDFVGEYELFLKELLRRFCLVEKSKATDLCRLTLEHGDSVDYGLIDGLTDYVCEVFPEQYRQVAEELSNPEIAKEVEEIKGGGRIRPL